jgi:hypothetical protein
VVQALEGSTWKTLAAGAKITGDAADTLAKPGQMGGMWAASDKTLHILYGTYVYVVSGEEIADAISTGETCNLDDDCTFDPTGDLAGEAAQYDHDSGKYLLRRLSCSGFSCQWSYVSGVDLGDSDQGGGSGAGRRVFFHDKDGKATLVRPVEGPDPKNDYLVVANTTEHRIPVLSGGAFFIGAAPRPGGGFAVAVRTYDRQLKLLAVSAGGQVNPIDLGGFSQGEEPIGVHVTGGSGAERVHVLLPETSTGVAHFVVDLPGGSFTHETIEMR